MSSDKLPVVALISGSGSNLQALIDASQDGAPYEIRAVISNRSDAYGLIRAQHAGIETRVIEHAEFSSREVYDDELQSEIDRYQPKLVVLAGFMRILTAGLVEHYAGRMLNIHPSLLPKYRGLHTHQRALEEGDIEAGCTVHFVTVKLDSGPNVVQAAVPFKEGDTPECLAARVLAQEHRIYPQAVSWFAEGRLALSNEIAHIDGGPILDPLQLGQQD